MEFARKKEVHVQNLDIFYVVCVMRKMGAEGFKRPRNRHKDKQEEVK